MASTTDPLGSDTGLSLLAANDPPAVQIFNHDGASSFLLIGDHAGKQIPMNLGTMGLAEADLDRHIAWDIGVAELGQALAAQLDATFIRQTYSRLVIDCNRDPASPEAIPAVSDGTHVPANVNLSEAGRLAREQAIHRPYQESIERELEKRDASGRQTTLVSLHSFTPSMNGHDRPWQIGILHGGGNANFAKTILHCFIESGDRIVGDNEPYAMDAIDHTVPRHAFEKQRPYVEIEVRQDLLESHTQQVDWAGLIRETLIEASHRVDGCRR